MAVRRTTFERVLDYWNCSISDDYSLTRAMRDAKLKIHYEPRCLIATHGDCNWRELLEWSTRQILITKIYCRRLWQLAFVSQFPFLIGWWWGIGQLGVAAWTVSSRTSQMDLILPAIWFGHLGAAMGIIYLFGVFRGMLRIKTINVIFPGEKTAINRLWWGYLLLAPLVSTLTAYNLMVSMFTSRLNWRGVCYELTHLRHDEG